MRDEIIKRVIHQIIIRIFILIGLSCISVSGVTLQWQQRDTEVWKREQIIIGKLDTMVASSGTLISNVGTQSLNIDPADSSFSSSVYLNEGKNWFVAVFNSGGVDIHSDTLFLHLKLPLKPILEAYATTIGREVTLHGRIIENPDSEEVTFYWREDDRNPSEFGLSGGTDSVVCFNIPEHVPIGEYYFNLVGITFDNDTVYARTFITANADSVHPFDIRRDHAAWIDSAVIYEITPYAFVMDGRFPDIQAKLPELKELGINTIWIQPICRTKWGEQGYDVIDYFKVRPDYGTEAELHDLIANAHVLGLKVLFDIVINHSSIYHRYAQHSIEYGTASHYYHYYQREVDDAPYSQHYSHYKGFINYFWDELTNLNYDNPEVRNWITTACKYWVEEFDIDGYRFDAVWGVTARCPEFTQDLRLALKRIKPEIMMLAEDKASWSNVFDKRFDVAFDWAPGEDWVSQWFWETDYAEWYTNNQYTIFNTGSLQDRVVKLRYALTNGGQGYAENAKILRFMGNNDMILFIRNHGLQRTKMVATLVFTLNGIPLIYNGQEIGYDVHPYYTYQIFQRNRSIRSQDDLGLYPFYQYLIQLRQEYSALCSDNIREVPIIPEDAVYAYHRWNQHQHLFGVVNMEDKIKNITMKLPLDDLNLDSVQTYYLSDLIGGSVYSGTVEELAHVNITIQGYTTSLFLLADSAVHADIQSDPVMHVAKEMQLHRNYPNPFNSTTTITYSIPRQGKVELTVLDILGREVAQLVNREHLAGEYSVHFNAERLPSGCYFYCLKCKNKTRVEKMLLMK